MKHKKMVIEIMLLLFIISGFYNVINVSANGETVYIPPLSYAGYHMGYLESGDQILINEIDSDGGISVYIMNKWQFNELKMHGNYYSEKMWQDIIKLSYARIDITDDDDYYVVLENDALITGRNVYVDLSVYRHIDTPDTRPVFVLLIIVGAIFGLIIIVLTIILVKRSKRKKREAVTQVQEVIKSKSFYCSNCGTENIDITSDFCSKCGSKIIR